MEKLKKFIVNLKVAGKLKAYRLTVLTMTVLLVAVAYLNLGDSFEYKEYYEGVVPGDRVYTGVGDIDHRIQS